MGTILGKPGQRSSNRKAEKKKNKNEIKTFSGLLVFQN